MSPDSIHPTPEELFAYRDGELAADRRVLIEAHVVGCHACRERIDRVSQLEAGLRQQPDQVEGDYYARLSRSVLERIGAGAEASAAAEPSTAAAVPPPLGEPDAVAAAQAPADPGVKRPEGPPRRERRRADLPAEARPSRAPRLPWPALVSTVAAAAAVVVVVVMLYQQGGVHRVEPGRVALRAPGESAAPKPSAPLVPTPAAQPPAAPVPQPSAAIPAKPVGGGLAEAPRAKGAGAESPSGTAPAAETQLAKVPLAQAPAAETKAAGRTAETEGPAAVSGEVAERADRLAMRKKDSAVRAPVSGPGSLAAPGALRTAKTNVATPDLAAEGPYRAILLRHGLPPLWEEGRVDRQALRGAEPELRMLYQMGRAGADSAGVRLYLAEAARLAYEAAPDSSLYDRIVHHYLRAIRLAGPNSDIGRTARERLQSFSR